HIACKLPLPVGNFKALKSAKVLVIKAVVLLSSQLSKVLSASYCSPGSAAKVFALSPTAILAGNSTLFNFINKLSYLRWKSEMFNSNGTILSFYGVRKILLSKDIDALFT